MLNEINDNSKLASLLDLFGIFLEQKKIKNYPDNWKIIKKGDNKIWTSQKNSGRKIFLKVSGLRQLAEETVEIKQIIG